MVCTSDSNDKQRMTRWHDTQDYNDEHNVQWVRMSCLTLDCHVAQNENLSVICKLKKKAYENDGLYKMCNVPTSKCTRKIPSVI